MRRLTVAAVLAELARRHPGIAEVLAGSPESEIRTVWLAEDLRDLGGTPPRALVLLGRAASREAQGYKLDVALRRLRDVAGLVLQSEAPQPSLSALALARREDIPLVRLTRQTDVAELVAVTVRMLDGQLPMQLDRAVHVCREVDRLDTAGVQDEDLVRRSGAAEMFGFALGRRDQDQQGTPAVLTDPEGCWLQRQPTIDTEDALAGLLMWRLAAAMTRRAIETDRAEQLSLLSAGELLNQLLDSAADGSSSLLRRAADVGIRVDAWNQIIVLEFANLLTLADEDAVTAYHYAQTLIRVVAQTASHHEGRWTVAPRAGGAVVLRTAAHADSPSALRKLKSTVGTMIDRAVEVFPAVEILCGIGGSHEGLQGMQASRAEAESALQSARLRGTVNQPTLFDAPGLSRLLVEWYSSTSVRQSIDDLLAPLNALGEAKQKEYVRTLRVYLENNRSVGRTSQQLYVHRNTVAYRISRILAVLDVDLDDPNQFLAIYLACYARSMPHATARGDAEPSGRARG